VCTSNALVAGGGGLLQICLSLYGIGRDLAQADMFCLLFVCMTTCQSSHVTAATLGNIVCNVSANSFCSGAALKGSCCNDCFAKRKMLNLCNRFVLLLLLLLLVLLLLCC